MIPLPPLFSLFRKFKCFFQVFCIAFLLIFWVLNGLSFFGYFSLFESVHIFILLIFSHISHFFCIFLYSLGDIYLFIFGDFLTVFGNTNVIFFRIFNGFLTYRGFSYFTGVSCILTSLWNYGWFLAFVGASCIFIWFSFHVGMFLSGFASFPYT